MSLIGAAAGQIFLAEASTVLRTKPDELDRLFRKSVGLLTFLGLAFALTSFWISPLFTFVFGQKWAEAGEFAFYLVFAASAQVIVSPVSNISILLSRQNLQLLLDVVRAVLIVLVFGLGWYQKLEPKKTVCLYAWSMVSVYSLSLWVYSRIVKKNHTIT
jgi:O-antigen/teichoic acid export membrane protein